MVFLTEATPSNPLLYMYWGPHISWCILPGSVSERSLRSILVETIGLPIGFPSCSVCYTNNQVLGVGDMSETLRASKKNGNSQPWEVES